jgi:hypothetical protein
MDRSQRLWAIALGVLWFAVVAVWGSALLTWLGV